MRPLYKYAALSVGAIAFCHQAYAHGFAGDHMFISTLLIDDPNVADEASLPTFQFLPNTTDQGGATYNTSFEFDKRITENFGFAVSDGYTWLTQPGGAKTLNGWNNLVVSLKYKPYVNAEHEFMFSVGVEQELARTGAVQVLGSTASYPLQIVPVLRSVGGTIASGNTIEIEATGLPPGEATILIDGRGVGAFTIKDTVDINQYGVNNPLAGQQILTLTVPPAIGSGIITVLTNGGSATLQTGITLAQQPAFVPSGDVGDTIGTASALPLPVNSAIVVPGTIGDGANGGLDVDMYAVTAAAGEQITITGTANFYSHIRVFNAAGADILAANAGYVSTNTPTSFSVVAPAAGTYYVAVSSYYNNSYNPTVAGSGASGYYTGTYTLTISTLAAGATSLTGIPAAASSGCAKAKAPATM